jgi:uncharacterized protein (TIGR02594 family)
MTKEILGTACLEIGVKEVIGEEDNPRIVEYHSATSLKATDDETPWCSAFVNWVLKEAGFQGTGNAMARSFLNWGKFLPSPRPGCIVVLKRGEPPSGHVGFYLGQSSSGLFYLLGGNQSNMVKISQYKEEDVLGYRWLPDGR